MFGVQLSSIHVAEEFRLDSLGSELRSLVSRLCWRLIMSVRPSLFSTCPDIRVQWSATLTRSELTM